jgi:hypothetical protein
MSTVGTASMYNLIVSQYFTSSKYLVELFCGICCSVMLYQLQALALMMNEVACGSGRSLFRNYMKGRLRGWSTDGIC